MPHSVLPGAEVVDLGIKDLSDGVESVPALLVSIGARRLQRLGIVVPHPFPSPERRLYALLQQTAGDAGHTRYNALIVVWSAMNARLNARRILRSLEALGDERFSQESWCSRTDRGRS